MDHEVYMPARHQHPLVFKSIRITISWRCELCGDLARAEERYRCDVCEEDFHKECVELPQEINYPLHPRHPLALSCFKDINVDDVPNCSVCGKECYGREAYRCSKCNLTVDVNCARYPTKKVVIDRPKSHMEHTLTLILKEISFRCDACGEAGHHSPWVCLQCYFAVHRSCIDIPHVIRINRHQHRISLTYSLHPGNLICGVCRREVDWKYGAYSCSACSYVVHTKCATNGIVWDGEELEGVPEETYEAVQPFKVIDDEVINHFSHKHNLKHAKNDSTVGYESRRCEACTLPISSDPSYNCGECGFILHEACANLPLQKQHPLSPESLSLHADKNEIAQLCNRCDRYFGGFRYERKVFRIDVNCGSLSEPFIHEGHPHRLFFSTWEKRTCRACGTVCAPIISRYALSCTECDFALCCKCATLPRTVRHKYDEHPAILCLGEHDQRGPYTYWCEICEEELDPKFRFYASDECGFTFHVRCLLGDFLFLKPGQRLQHFWGPEFDAVENNGTSRPYCWNCERRCRSPMILKYTEYTDRYLCSQPCLEWAVYRMTDQWRNTKYGM